MREIRGRDGDLYDAGSPAHHGSLEDLAGVLRSIGFKVSRKRPGFTTLVVYALRHAQYPLLNPRFRQYLDDDDLPGLECLEVTTLSKDRTGSLHAELVKFARSERCWFDQSDGEDSTYRIHGAFVLPLRFVDHGDCVSLDFAALAVPLRELHAFLAAMPWPTHTTGARA